MWISVCIFSDQLLHCDGVGMEASGMWDLCYCCWGICMADMEYKVQVGLVGAFLLICMEDSAWCTPLNGLMTCICGEEWEGFLFIRLD
jgi:hypothetical protein